tara:strand:- start:239 stop:538 length:300 start_codon:yes stop_codon:yes gene_type:complete
MPQGLQKAPSKIRVSLKCNDCLVFKYVNTPAPYLHFFVGKKYGNAVQRNLFKRRTRLLYHSLNKKLSPTVLGISVYPMKNNVSYAELKSCFKILEKRVL